MESREDREARERAHAQARELQAQANAAQAEADRLLGSGHRVEVPSIQKIADKHVARIELRNLHARVVRRYEGQFEAERGRRPSKAERKAIRKAASAAVGQYIREQADGAS